MNIIRQRRSVRDFCDIEVADDIIKEVLISGFCAPSAGNQMPWEFFVVKNREILDELASASPYASCLKKAKQAIVLANYKEVRHPKYVYCDMSACTENILLELENQGLGGVWLGISPDSERITKVNNILKLDNRLDSFAIIPFGYKKEKIAGKSLYFSDKVHFIR